MAKENGHEFTMDDAKSTFEAIKDSDDGLTEFELEAVSGGWGNWCFWC